MANTSSLEEEQKATPTKKASRRVPLLSLSSSIVINGVLPFIIYSLLKNHTTEFIALVASGIPSMIDSIVGIIRRKSIDFIAGFTLLAIAVTLGITALGGSPKVYLIRESFFTLAIGLAYLVSLLLPKPLMFYFARASSAGNDPQHIVRFNTLWQQNARFRKAMRVISVMWGVGFILEAAIRTYLVLTLTIAQFLVVSPFVLYGFIGVLVGWTVLYARRGRKFGEELAQQTTQQQEAAG